MSEESSEFDLQIRKENEKIKELKEGWGKENDTLPK